MHAEAVRCIFAIGLEIEAKVPATSGNPGESLNIHNAGEEALYDAYDPGMVFSPPRLGFFIVGAIGFGFGVTFGFAFAPWGWGASRFFWDRHELIIACGHWGRTWVNRGSYVHPYHGFQRWSGPRGEERHERIARNEAERRAAHEGHARVEEHGHDRGDQ